MSTSQQRSLPTRYTFLNPKILISQDAEKIVVKLLDKASKEDSDTGDLYSYMLLGLIDKTLSTIHTKITKKQWDEAWCNLEALTVFMNIEDSWPMCDDGERSSHTNKVYGASLVTTIRALQEENRFDPAHIPNLNTVLKMASEWGSSMSQMGLDRIDYHLVCQGIGKRLFAGKDEELETLHKAQLAEWMKTLKASERKALQEAMEEDDDDEDDEDEGPWYANKDADENDEDEDYKLSRSWKKYKDHLAGVPDLDTLRSRYRF